MDYRNDWKLRRPATVKAAEQFLGILQGYGILDDKWTLNFRKQYIGLLKGRAPNNIVRFLDFQEPMVEFRLSRDPGMDQGLTAHKFSWRYRRGGYQVRLLESDFEREINVLIKLADRAKKAYGRPRDPQGEIEELRLILGEAKDTLSEIRDSVTEKRSEMDRFIGAMEAESKRTKEARTNAEASQQTIETWAKKLPNYAERMEEFSEQMKRNQDLEQRLEAWLERAVPAGLAGGFQERRRGFNLPKVIWGALFVALLGSLALLAYYDPVRMQIESTFLGALTYVFSRVPYAVPLLWGAFFASRRVVQTLRLEEEYAHKEVLSGAFESYRKHIQEMEKGSPGEQSNTLIEVFLEMLRNHPGHVFRRDQREPNRPNRFVSWFSRLLRFDKRT